MEKNKILVTGANGQLGNEIRVLSKKYSNLDFIFTDVEELDLINKERVDNFFNSNQISWIINCAAYTAVDKAEEDYDLAYKINVEAVENLVNKAKEYNIPIIHISTDFVFDGQKNTPYFEDDITNPINQYGKTKLEGEKIVETYEHGIIIRTAWLYSTFGNNFVKTIIKKAEEQNSLKVVFDQIGSPTYAKDLAEFILLIVNKEYNHKNIFHFSNEGVASWYDFACSIIEYYGIECNIEPVFSEEFITKANRPKYSVLSKKKVKEVFKIRVPYWRDSLKECIEKLKFGEK